MAGAPTGVFINCPFDDGFAPGFRALVYGVIACGFKARCALELDDAGEPRIEKIYRIIEQCRFGIHDISRTELDPKSKLPRFNMPLELGMFLGAKRFGVDNQKLKRCMILDKERYRYQSFMSDIAGMDIKVHAGEPRKMVQCVRDFLITVSKSRAIPAVLTLMSNYDEFIRALPDLAERASLDLEDMLFPDYERLVIKWVRYSRETR